MSATLPTFKQMNLVSIVSAGITMAVTSRILSLLDGRLKIVHPIVFQSGIVAYAGTAVTEIIDYSFKKFRRQERENSEELFGTQHLLYISSAITWPIGNLIFGVPEIRPEDQDIMMVVGATTYATLAAMGGIICCCCGSKKAAMVATLIAISRSTIALIFEYGPKAFENQHRLS